jgi:hypothetical protein
MINIKAAGAVERLSEKSAYLDAFFRTVKKVVPAEKFPLFFKELHIDGEVPVEKVETLLQEVKDIEAILKTIKPDPKLLEDPDFQATPDLQTRYLNSKATNLAEWFQTQQKLNMFEVLIYNIDYARRKNAPVYIKYYLM